MHKLYELKEKLMKELEEYADNGKFSKDDVEAIKYTASAIDHICNIVEDMDGEYSMGMGGDSYEGGSYNYGGSYARGGGNRGGGGGRSNAGGSYARGGRGGRRGGANQYGSYAGGYSRASEELAMELRELMKDAPDERIRQEIQNLVQRVEQM